MCYFLALIDGLECYFLRSFISNIWNGKWIGQNCKDRSQESICYSALNNSNNRKDCLVACWQKTVAWTERVANSEQYADVSTNRGFFIKKCRFWPILNAALNFQNIPWYLYIQPSCYLFKRVLLLLLSALLFTLLMGLGWLNLRLH